MKKIVRHLRSQPEEVRRQVLHVLTIIAGIILGLLWIYSLGTRLNSPETQIRTSNDLQPFSTLKDNMVSGYNSLSRPEAPLEQ